MVKFGRRFGKLGEIDAEYLVTIAAHGGKVERRGTMYVVAVKVDHSQPGAIVRTYVPEGVVARLVERDLARRVHVAPWRTSVVVERCVKLTTEGVKLARRLAVEKAVGS